MIGSSEMRRLTTDPAMDIMPESGPPTADRSRSFASLPTGERRDPPDLARRWVGPEAERLPARLRAALVVARRSLAGRGRATLPRKGPGRRRPVEAASTSCRWTAASPGPSHPAGGRRGRRPLRSPPTDATWPTAPASALARYIAVVELGPDYMPTGAARRVTRGRIWPDGGFCWTRDGKSVVYVQLGHPPAVAGRDHGRPPTAADRDRGPPARFAPTTAARRDRLVFVRGTIRHGHLPVRGRATGGARHHVFVPGRPPPVLPGRPAGRVRVPALRRDGDLAGRRRRFEPKQLTHQPGLGQGSPRWSPDGRRIAFDSQGEDGRWDIWTIDADGGSPRRLTHDPGDENNPNWSRTAASSTSVPYRRTPPRRHSTSGGFPPREAPRSASPRAGATTPASRSTARRSSS